MMKRHAIFISVLFLLMLIIPFLAMGGTDPGQASPPENSSQTTEGSSPSASPAVDAESFRILDETTGEIVTVSNEEFAIGGVAAEMPPTFEPEALKAQAVAAYTYYSNLRQQERESPTPDLKGAEFSADLSNREKSIGAKVKCRNLGENISMNISKAFPAPSSLSWDRS